MFRNCRRVLPGCAIAAALAGAAPSALALDPSRALDRYVHQAWTTDQGLPQNSVYAIAATRDGYLWLGTDEGLARFDGARFTVFDRVNTPEIRDPRLLQPIRRAELGIHPRSKVVENPGVYVAAVAADVRSFFRPFAGFSGGESRAGAAVVDAVSKPGWDRFAA